MKEVLRRGKDVTVVTYGAYGVTDSAKVMTTNESPAATKIPLSKSKP